MRWLTAFHKICGERPAGDRQLTSLPVAARLQVADNLRMKYENRELSMLIDRELHRENRRQERRRDKSGPETMYREPSKPKYERLTRELRKEVGGTDWLTIFFGR